MGTQKAKEVLEKYLKAWIKRDPEKMYKHCQITWQSDHSKNELRDLFRDINLEDYSIGNIYEIEGISLCKIRVHAKINKEKCAFEAILACETEAYSPREDGKWGVNPVSILKIE